MTTEPNETAFPVGADPQPQYRGLTKREHIVIEMAKSIVAQGGILEEGEWLERNAHRLKVEDNTANESQAISIAAIDLADALIRELNGG